MFDANSLYLNTDPALDVIAPRRTRDHWRMHRKGPAFIKLGGHRVAYSGADLNAWLAAQRVPTADQPADQAAPAAA